MIATTTVEISLHPEKYINDYSDKVTAKKEKLHDELKENPDQFKEDSQEMSKEEKQAIIDAMLGGGS